MEIISISAQPKESAITGVSFYNYELPRLVQKLKDDCAWRLGDMKSIVILNSSGTQVILTGLHPKTEVESKQTGEWLNFHIIEGRLKLKTRKETVILEQGQKFTLKEKTKYKLKSLNETIFLFTIATQVFQKSM